MRGRVAILVKVYTWPSLFDVQSPCMTKCSSEQGCGVVWGCSDSDSDSGLMIDSDSGSNSGSDSDTKYKINSMLIVEGVSAAQAKNKRRDISY